MFQGKTYRFHVPAIMFVSSLVACNNIRTPDKNAIVAASQDTLSCQSNIPSGMDIAKTENRIRSYNKLSTEGMVWIEGGTFAMGADNNEAAEDEYPKHKVTMKGFYMDVTEVTNAQFAVFVEETKYVTTAERKPDWEEMKKHLPPGTPKPAESLFFPASLVFKTTKADLRLNDFHQCWEWKEGANWRQPHGPGSSIEGKENHPVVHISWLDVQEFCKWAGKRLPTEAEWEWAARGGLADNIYPWGNESVNTGKMKGNFWQGRFPEKNDMHDQFYYTAPVKSFQTNGYGLFDMAGNVWEWCADYYHHEYYKQSAVQLVNNPEGPEKSFDPAEPYMKKRVLRGGSFLCNDSYCSGYRVARRMKNSEDTSMEHVGFRCVKDK